MALRGKLIIKIRSTEYENRYTVQWENGIPTEPLTAQELADRIKTWLEGLA